MAARRSIASVIHEFAAGENVKVSKAFSERLAREIQTFVRSELEQEGTFVLRHVGTLRAV